mmetsp:Transcript_80125/g.230000  ORF Transcript_80125/g.230000 Transcript_80125/m.230000 type:complete len:288 (-) Transcript_80125:39-902(-)
MSVGDEGGACDIGAEAEPIGPEPTGPEPGGTTSTPTMSSRVGVVGDAISVGTGMSVGVAGTGSEPERTERNAVVLPVALPVALARASAIAVTLALRGTGTSPRASGPVGDEGDGNSVGTGMSVGEDGAPGGADPMPADTMLADGTSPCFGAGGTPTSASSSAVAGAADVGEGNSVGTGMSVGDDGAGMDIEERGSCEERCWALPPTLPDVGPLAAMGATTSSSVRVVGTVMTSVGSAGVRSVGAAAVGTSIASSKGTGEVGAGSSVGTGISVGEDGAERPVSSEDTK